MNRKIMAPAQVAARQRDQPVGEVPLVAIAKAADMSRSTLLRRIGNRAALDEACRQAGIDPGNRVPVRDRAVTAAAELITKHGLGALTLEATAVSARRARPRHCA